MGGIVDSEERYDLVCQVGEEIISKEELKELLEKKKNPVAYDGFEPSGVLHLGHGLLRAINIS
jgi:tyrosyl-tRNA synthetase